MFDPFEKLKAKKRSGFRLLEFDSFIDSEISGIFDGVGRGWNAFSAFMYRFRLTGFKRWLSELAGDAANLGALGAVAMLTLAIPAFYETDESGGWLKTSEYSVTFLDRYGNEIGKRGILRNNSVPLEEIPDVVIKAVLATEDRRFFLHFGIDFMGTSRALIENMRAGGVVQGGSSITQQLAKNLFLTPEQTLERKIKEAFLATWLEARLTKKEILKLYLDRAYMGGGAYGVDAAAEFYFSKSIRDVTLAEAAMLAGLFKAPTKYAPHNDLPAARARANEVLDNMVEAGFLTEGQVFAARKNPANAVSRADFYSPDYFLDWAYDAVLTLARDFPDQVLVVKTTVDTSLQRHAEQSVETMLRQNGEAYNVREASLVSMDTDGAVRAIVGGRDYGESQFNRATQALRQPGSSFKPFVYLTALMNGFSPDSVVVDQPINIGGWTPRNYSGGFVGRIRLTDALVRSINTIPVQLAQAIGRDKIVDTTRKAGIKSDIIISRSLPLGAADLTVMEMTGAYATFASGGLRAEPYGVLEVRNSRGDLLYEHWRNAPEREQVFPREKVEELNNILSQVVSRGTGRRAILDGVGAAGKTGTTNGYRNAWFMGYTGKYVTGVWYGNDNYASTRRVTGGSLPAMTWHRYMSYAHQGIEVPDIPGVPGSGTGDALLLAGEDGDAIGARPRTLSAPTQRLLRALAEDFARVMTVAGAPDGPNLAAAPADRDAVR